jgi:hypothetical protein
MRDLPPVRAFGTWDAPVTDGADWIEAPTDLACCHCEERFREGDNGAIMPTGLAHHRECSFRIAVGGIGHLVDHARYCRSALGTDAGLSARQSALLVWRHKVDGPPVYEDELEELRRG